ncbi:MAG: hypothetical protein WDA14_06500 [Sphaerochaetaceae bacterium]|jgi:hypothetical protein
MFEHAFLDIHAMSGYHAMFIIEPNCRYENDEIPLDISKLSSYTALICENGAYEYCERMAAKVASVEWLSTLYLDNLMICTIAKNNRCLWCDFGFIEMEHCPVEGLQLANLCQSYHTVNLP